MRGSRRAWPRSSAPAAAWAWGATVSCRASARTGRFWNLQSGGLTPHETLKVATIFGAEALGLQRDVGSLESGKLADLIVFDRNPLADIRNTESIRYVMKNGELFEGDTLNQVWPSARPLPKMYWMDTDPPRRVAAPRQTTTQ